MLTGDPTTPAPRPVMILHRDDSLAYGNGQPVIVSKRKQRKRKQRKHNSTWLTINRDTDLRIVGLARYGTSDEPLVDEDWYRFKVTQDCLRTGRPLPPVFLMSRTIWG